MEGTAGVVIDATPLPVKRKGIKRAKKGAVLSPHKDENKEPVSPFTFDYAIVMPLCSDFSSQEICLLTT